MFAQPDLHKLNEIVHEKQLEHLVILLTDNDYARESIANLSSNEDALTIKKAHQQLQNKKLTLLISTLTMIDSKCDWFIGYVKDKFSEFKTQLTT